VARYDFHISISEEEMTLSKQTLFIIILWAAFIIFGLLEAQ